MQESRGNFKRYTRYVLEEGSLLRSFTVFVLIPRRSEFEKNIALDKKDFGAIEYLLRKGQRQLESYSASGITNIRA